jgi:hypothetical protein
MQEDLGRNNQRFTEKQIIGILKLHKNGMAVSKTSRLKQLEDENRRFLRLVCKLVIRFYFC